MNDVPTYTPQGVVENRTAITVFDLCNASCFNLSKKHQIVEKVGGLVAVGYRSVAGSEGQGVEGQHLIAASNGVGKEAA